jgi:hypothetical protein
MSYAGWIEYDTQTNAEATATRTKEASKQHIIYAITATLSTALTASSETVALKDEGVTIWEGSVTTGRETYTFLFPKGIAITANHDATATLGAGGSGIIGNVGLHGETV